jgi:type II secretory pathway predicted ATPase ExeA
MASSDFYIGRVFDAKGGKVTGQRVEYESADLTTHAFVTGMTGSGKTGLCVALLEEAALQGIPAIVIDPKGDLTNLLLHFPALAARDFQSWIDPEMARRSGKTVDQAAQETAQLWQRGLADWDIPMERVQALQDAAQYAIFTPGSDSGISVSVLASLAAPGLAWESNREVIREKISSTVTALLSLVGFQDIDPVRSREHILLANIFEAAWSQGRDVDLSELILQTQSPPFERLGALAVDAFFPAKDRMELAMLLNNILAAPGFGVWREGQPLDIQSMLFTETGRPRHSVFYLAHLSDTERMFFVTLLLAAVETWMRTQGGVASLRALLYMDEIHGYLPPVANPPSKGPLLRMLKQARAFGLGLILATQNPVDMDYKAISNAGTWFVGKLQTEQDKNRLLDGLEGAGAGASRAQLDKLVGSLGKRVFLLHNVHAKEPVLMHSRWAMNYLAGPLTRAQIPALNRLADATTGRADPPQRGSIPARAATPLARTVAPAAAMPSPSSSAGPRLSSEASLTKPGLPAGVREYFLPQNASLPEAFSVSGRPMPPGARLEGVLYRTGLLAAAQVRFLDRKYGVDSEIERVLLVTNLDRRGMVRWEDAGYGGPALDKLESTPDASARFIGLEAPLNDGKLLTALQKDFADWVFRNSSVTARANAALKVYGGPDVTQADFVKACADAARQGRDVEHAKQAAKFDRQLQTLQDRLAREEGELRQDQSDLQNRKLEAGANLLELGAGLVGFGRKKSVTSQFTKQRMSQNAKADVEESEQAIGRLRQQMAEVQKERDDTLAAIDERWASAVNDTTEVTVNARKTDVFIHIFGVAWLPHYVVQAGGETFELPAFLAG